VQNRQLALLRVALGVGVSSEGRADLWLARAQDSYVELDLKFSEDSKLREQYVGGLSKVRMGRLMEGEISRRFAVHL